MRRAVVLFVLLLALAACSREEEPAKPKEEAAPPVAETIQPPAEPVAPGVDWRAKDFSAAVEAARESAVRLALPASEQAAARWVDAWLAPEAKRRYGLTLERVTRDPEEMVAGILAAKDQPTGDLDLIWSFGRVFRTLRQAGALFGPFAGKLPNHQAYVNQALASQDFGLATEGFESPWGWEQFVFEYDSARVKNPPANFAALLEWARAHPGRFTYPRPGDPVGSAFLRQALFAVSGGYQRYMIPFKPDFVRERFPLLWSYLHELTPHLWKKGREYPKDAAELAALLAKGELDMGMSFEPLHAQGSILAGVYKDTVRTTVLENSLYPLRFLAIPANAANKPGAMLVADLVLSPEAQLSKFQPKAWGDFPAVDVSRLPESFQAKIVGTHLGKASLSFGALGVSAVPEIPEEYGEALDKAWAERFGGL